MTSSLGVVIVRLDRDKVTGKPRGWWVARCRRCFWFETDQAGTRDIHDLARGHVDWHKRYGPWTW